MKIKSFLIITFVVLVTLLDYKLAKFVQSIFIIKFQNLGYLFSVSISWLLVGMVPFFIFNKDGGLTLDTKKVIVNKRQLIIYSLDILLGLVLFLMLGISKYFSSIKYPFIFFIITPIVEESIFRGWGYGIIEKLSKKHVIVITSLLFALHHLQYFNFSLTKFAIFQIIYTFVLGLLLGKIRKLSGGIYIGLALHILLNFAVVYF